MAPEGPENGGGGADADAGAGDADVSTAGTRSSHPSSESDGTMEEVAVMGSGTAGAVDTGAGGRDTAKEESGNESATGLGGGGGGCCGTSFLTILDFLDPGWERRISNVSSSGSTRRSRLFGLLADIEGVRDGTAGTLLFSFGETTGTGVGVGLGGSPCPSREFADKGVTAAAELETETETGIEVGAGAGAVGGGCGLDFTILGTGVGRDLVFGSGLGSGFVSGISPSLSSSSCLIADWCA